MTHLHHFIIIVISLIPMTFSYRYDYELMVTYTKYLRIMRASYEAYYLSLPYMLQTTSQNCMQKQLNVYETDEIPEKDIERKQFDLNYVIPGRSRDMKEAYAVMLAGPLCNSEVTNYFNKMFNDLLDLLKSNLYAENVECFKESEDERLIDGDCEEVYQNFTTDHVNNQMSTVRKLVYHHGYPKCIMRIGLEIAKYNLKAVIFANSDAEDFDYFIERDNFNTMMKTANNQLLACILNDLEEHSQPKTVKLIK